MKKLVLFSLCLGLFFLSNAQNYKRYADKSGRIEYTWSGKMKGSEVLVWDDYGAVEKRSSNTEMKLFGMTEKTNTVIVMIKDKMYSWKVGEKKGSVTDSPFLAQAAENIDDWEKFGNEMMKSMKYEKKGSETVAGKMCDRWEGPLGKIWVYKSYALRTDASVMGINSTQLVSHYAAGSAVPASELELPKDVEFEDVSKRYEENESDDADSKKAKEMIKNFMEGF